MKNLVVTLMVVLFAASAQAGSIKYQGKKLDDSNFRREAKMQFLKYFASVEEADAYAEHLVATIEAGEMTRHMLNVARITKKKACSLNNGSLGKVNAWLASGNGEVSAKSKIKESGSTTYEDGMWTSKSSFLLNITVTVPCYRSN